MNFYPSVLLFADDGANPLGVARSLGRKGISVSVLTTSKPSILRSCRYIKKVYDVSAFHKSKEVKTQLEKFLHDNETTNVPVLLVTNESHYADLLPLKEFVDEHFNTVNPLDRLVFLSDKTEQNQLAEQAGFYIPKTLTLQKSSDLELLATLQFPVIVKPNSAHTRGQFTAKTELYENAEVLNTAIFPFLQEGNTTVIAQEFVVGADSNVKFLFASCGEKGEVRLCLSGHKIRQNPPGRGVMASGGIDSKQDAVLCEKSKALCRLFGLKGFIGIECKLDDVTGKYCYIESSIRTDGYNSIALAAGVDVVFDSYLAAIGVPLPKRDEVYVPDTIKAVSWADMELELGTLKELRRAGNPAWKGFFKWLPRPVAWAYFTWDDPMPWVLQTFRFLSKRMKAIFSKR